MQSQELFETLETRYGRITTFANDSGALTRALRKYGEWAGNELRFLRAMIDEGATVLDVGAYIGTHTLAFSGFVGPTGHVIAFEPQSSSFELLLRNIGTNRLANVRAEHAAAGAEPGEAVATSIDIGAPDNFGHASLLDTPREGAATQVRIMSIDALGLTSCALIKIDVEGVEDLVLQGAARTLRSSAPLVYAECNSLDRGLKALAALKDLGYRVLAHVAPAYDADNFFAETENLFGSACEVALIGVPDAYSDRIARYTPRPSELLLDVETADDLAFALLKKPQYETDVLREGAAARSYQNARRNQVDGAGDRAEIDQRERLERTEGALAEARRLAFERFDEVEGLRVRLDQTDVALAETQRLAFERFDEIEGLRARLDQTDVALAEVQRLAIERLEEIERLHERIEQADAAFTLRGAAERPARTAGS